MHLPEFPLIIYVGSITSEDDQTQDLAGMYSVLERTDKHTNYCLTIQYSRCLGIKCRSSITYSRLDVR